MAKIKVINDKGEEEEIETYTKDEVDSAVKAKEDEFNEKLKEKDETATKLAGEKAELEKKIQEASLAGIKEDHPNFKILKEALQKKDTEISEIKNTIEKDRNELKISTVVNKVSRGDAELEKKIRFHLENTVAGMKSDTPEALQAKVDAAIKLSIDHNSQGIFDGGIGGGGAGGGNFKSENSVEFTAREKALGAKMGISDADYKKYGPKLSK